jgi:hypothetical protein
MSDRFPAGHDRDGRYTLITAEGEVVSGPRARDIRAVTLRGVERRHVHMADQSGWAAL